jgi:hypothetical protein
MALLAGALFNAHLNRRRDDRLRRHERVAIATSLYAELERIRETLLENRETLRKPAGAGEGFFVRAPLSVQIMPELIDKLGLLPAKVIKEVTGAYILIGQYKQDLLFLSDISGTESENGVFMSAGVAPTVIKLNTVKADVIGRALEVLKPHLK